MQPKRMLPNVWKKSLRNLLFKDLILGKGMNNQMKNNLASVKGNSTL